MRFFELGVPTIASIPPSHTLRHPEPLLLENRIHIVALTPDLQKVSFYSVTDFLYHSSTTKPILSLMFHKGILSEAEALPLYKES
jgi:hypothetical protein